LQLFWRDVPGSEACVKMWRSKVREDLENNFLILGCRRVNTDRNDAKQVLSYSNSYKVWMFYTCI
jgi:hypothetical protein